LLRWRWRCCGACWLLAAALLRRWSRWRLVVEARLLRLRRPRLAIWAPIYLVARAEYIYAIRGVWNVLETLTIHDCHCKGKGGPIHLPFASRSQISLPFAICKEVPSAPSRHRIGRREPSIDHGNAGTLAVCGRQPYQTPRSLQRRGGRGDGDQHPLSAAGARRQGTRKGRDAPGSTCAEWARPSGARCQALFRRLQRPVRYGIVATTCVAAAARKGRRRRRRPAHGRCLIGELLRVQRAR
jgi:hypothetical protein